MVALSLLARGKKIIFGLHDFTLITGGCAAPEDCRRYAIGCGKCPQVGRWPLVAPVDVTRMHYKLHHYLATHPNCLGITPSQFLGDAAHQGAWSGGRLSVIANGVDTTAFTPHVRSVGRATLGLGPETFLLLFVSSQVHNPWKGLSHIEKIWPDLAHRHPQLRLAIVGDRQGTPSRLSPNVLWLGSIRESTQLAQIYASADCMLVPSLADTFNLTALEALSCGTPTIVYPTGGMPEFVPLIPGGMVLARAEPSLLKDAIEAQLAAPCDSAHRSRAWNVARDHFDLERMIDQYLAQYAWLLSNGRHDTSRDAHGRD
jgi:glycosyltransferase involved in cell wall biosynthesis